MIETLKKPFHLLGQRFMELSFHVGGVCLMLWWIFVALMPPRLDGPEMWKNMYQVGVKSFPIVVVTAIFTGAIMVIQSGIYVKQYGAEGLLGWGAGFSVLREVGPILIGLMFSGRVGANNTAELGTMMVTEQIDALRALAIDPIQYLVVPRFLSMVLMMFLLVVVGDLTALVGGAFTSQYLLGVDMELFYWSLVTYVTLMDFLSGVIKAVAFGFVIGVISCHFGMTVSGGAVGVGRAVNNSVVASAIGIFVLDYFLTWIMQ
jgi:phospholipid/cholesterol/gamma-HCH transport system permease protein